MTRKQHVDYWTKSAAENMRDMRAAIKSKRRTNALFCGHLAIEKMLKGLCAAKDVRVYAEHKLLVLADNAGIAAQLSVIQKTELATITGFNIQARYDDYKRRFSALCTPEYTNEWSGKISRWYKDLRILVEEERKLLPDKASDLQTLVR